MASSITPNTLIAGTLPAPAATLPPYTYGRDDEPPFILPKNVDLIPNLVYAAAFDRDWQLDLFLPRTRPVQPAPGAVCLHGGSGTRQQMWQHAAYLAARGFVSISAEHAAGRPEHRRPWPELIGLPQAAVRWLRTRADELHVDPQRIGAVGGSASGRLVALLGSSDAPQDGISSRVQAVVIMKGGVFRDLASPASAPTLFIHGEADPIAPYAATAAYYDQLRALGVPCELHNEPSATHRFPQRALYYQRCLPIMTDFLVTQLGNPVEAPTANR
jgi:acetyl esterase/lipase